MPRAARPALRAEVISRRLVRLTNGLTLILETGRDEISDIEAQGAAGWVAAVNADGNHGEWRYALAST